MRRVSLLLFVGVALCCTQVATGGSMLHALEQDGAYCGRGALDFGWRLLYMGFPALGAVCLAVAAASLRRRHLGNSGIFLYTAVVPVLIRSFLGWAAVFLVPTEGCAGEGGLVVNDGRMLAEGLPQWVEMTAVVGTSLTLFIAIVHRRMAQRNE